MAGGRLAAIVLIVQAWGLVAEAGGGEWETCRWDELTIEGERPSPRFDYQMAADVKSGRLFVFGGMTADGVCDDLWMFDETAGRFVMIEPAVGSPRPAARRGGVMAWAPRRQMLVLVGGEYVQGGSAHAWMFDFPTRWWHRLEAPPGRSPAPKSSGVVAYDPQSGRLVFAGTAGGGWVLDVDQECWRRVDTTPGIGDGAILVTVPEEGRALLLGSRDDRATGRPGGMWWFDYLTITWQRARLQSPMAEGDHALGAAFQDRSRLLLVACRHPTGRPAGIDVICIDLATDHWSVVGSPVLSGRGGRPTARVSAGAAAIGMAPARSGAGGITGFLLFGGRPELPQGCGISPLGDLWLLRPR